jgi:cytidylate kinase
MSRVRERGVVVAIDGPAGAGKSSVSRRVAAALGYTLVDTGAMYRAVGFVAKARGVSLDDAEGLGRIAESLDLAFEPGESEQRVIIEGTDRSHEIRHPDISAAASLVSRHVPVRAALVAVQRRLGAEGGVVLEGRDIGTVVFPDAEAKVFLTASPEERASRRVAELVEKGHEVDYDETLAQIRERDALDENREIAPLKPAQDAVSVDSTGADLDTIVRQIVAFVRTRL